MAKYNLPRAKERWKQQKARYSKELRIQHECEKPDYESPCKPMQHWECRKNEVDRWRIYKCRGSFCSCAENENFQDSNEDEKENQNEKENENEFGTDESI